MSAGAAGAQSGAGTAFVSAYNRTTHLITPPAELFNCFCRAASPNYFAKLPLESLASGVMVNGPDPIANGVSSHKQTDTAGKQTYAMDPLEKQLETFRRQKPTLGKGVYIAPGAVLLGAVTLGDHSSVWPNAVLRGDINRIVIGHHSNIQDTAVLHLSDEHEYQVGNFTTVGHGAIVHACKIGNEVLVGMGSTILDGVEVGDQCIIGAASLVTQQMQVPP